VARTLIRVRTELDAAQASREARTLAEQIGLGSTAAVGVATAVSELAMNQVRHATGGGTIEVYAVEGDAGPGISVVASDAGPGIADVEQAMRDGFSTAGSLGLGLSGARRLVDEFRIESARGAGTEISLVKWLAGRSPEPDRIASWAIAGPAGGAVPVVKAFAGGLLLAVTDGATAVAVRSDPERAVAALLDQGAAGAVAVLAARDGALSWACRGPGDAVLAGSEVDHAPNGRAATRTVQRGDWIVVAGHSIDRRPLADPVPTDPGRVAAASASGGTAIAALLRRGALEPRVRS